MQIMMFMCFTRCYVVSVYKLSNVRMDLVIHVHAMELTDLQAPLFIRFYIPPTITMLFIDAVVMLPAFVLEMSN